MGKCFGFDCKVYDNIQILFLYENVHIFQGQKNTVSNMLGTIKKKVLTKEILYYNNSYTFSEAMI